jgi:hypothetical protein
LSAREATCFYFLGRELKIPRQGIKNLWAGNIFSLIDSKKILLELKPKEAICYFVIQ